MLTRDRRVAVLPAAATKRKFQEMICAIAVHHLSCGGSSRLPLRPTRQGRNRISKSSTS